MENINENVNESNSTIMIIIEGGNIQNIMTNVTKNPDILVLDYDFNEEKQLYEPILEYNPTEISEIKDLYF
jgi:hypothetical protein